MWNFNEDDRDKNIEAIIQKVCNSEDCKEDDLTELKVATGMTKEEILNKFREVRTLMDELDYTPKQWREAIERHKHDPIPITNKNKLN